MTKPFLTLANKLPDYVSVSQRKVKWARIQVQPSGEVLIVVPQILTSSEVFDVYQSKQRWIENKRAKALRRLSEYPSLPDNELMLFGRSFQVQVDSSEKRHARLNHGTGVITYAKNLLDKRERQRWYRDFAKQYLSVRLVQLAELHGFKFNRLFVREQKTRWGSCSSRGNISLNWKLVKAPVWVSDYVILHELVHTEIMNHSAVFWQRIDALVPEYRKAKEWLRTNGCHL